MREYLLYLGCTTPVRLPSYEAATKAVLGKLGIKLLDFKDVTCCGAQYIESINPRAHIGLGGRILALAENQGKDVLAICGACSGSLKHSKHILDKDKGIRREVNSMLREEGLKYTGNVQVKHLLQVLRDDIGYEHIRKAVTRRFSGVRLVAHYGCHVTRPYDVVKVDDPENPRVIDEIIECIGAVAVDYPDKTRCCGGPLLAMDEELATLIGAGKIKNARGVGAEGIVTACVFCDIHLSQVQIGDNEVPEPRVPIITLPQLMGLAYGIDKESLGINLNRISPEGILSKLQEGVGQ